MDEYDEIDRRKREGGGYGKGENDARTSVASNGRFVTLVLVLSKHRFELYVSRLENAQIKLSPFQTPHAKKHNSIRDVSTSSLSRSSGGGYHVHRGDVLEHVLRGVGESQGD